MFADYGSILGAPNNSAAVMPTRDVAEMDNESAKCVLATGMLVEALGLATMNG